MRACVRCPPRGGFVRCRPTMIETLQPTTQPHTTHHTHTIPHSALHLDPEAPVEGMGTTRRERARAATRSSSGGSGMDRGGGSVWRMRCASIMGVGEGGTETKQRKQREALPEKNPFLILLNNNPTLNVPALAFYYYYYFYYSTAVSISFQNLFISMTFRQEQQQCRCCCFFK